jgi:hypothetical protein
MAKRWRGIGATVLIIGIGITLSGCVVVPARPGFCYYHPYRCR